jgi:hypothetical protein
MKPIVSTLVLLMLLTSAFAQKPRIVTAAEANGAYDDRSSEIKILALGHNKLRIQMNLTYEYKTPSGPMANTGEWSGEATIENDVAVLYPSDNHDCKVTIKFLPGNKIKVSEEHTFDCGWGLNVSSAGTYRKTKAGKPKFDEDR